METLQPKLRFPKFESNLDYLYKKQSFEDVFLFSTGKNIKQSEASPEFETLCVRYGELYHMYNEVIKVVINRTNLDKSELIFSQGDEILLPSAGEDPLDIGSASALTIADVAIGRTINILKPLKQDVYSNIYAAYYINNKLRAKIATLAKGVSISNVYNSDLKTLDIILPSIEEQTRIANFLSSVDEKLNLLKEKKALLEEYKKGIMQKIFNQELRFKDDNGKDFENWEEKSFKSVLKNIPTKKHQIQSSDILVVGIYPVIDQGKKMVAGFSDNLKNLFVDYPVIVFGDHTTILKYIDFDFIVGADGTKLLKNINNDNLKYLFYNLIYNNVEQEGYKRHFSILSEIILQIPSLKEQTKIANFLSAIDQKIELVSNQIEDTQEYKKGLLQQMFV